jgi:hypothetical protein
MALVKNICTKIEDYEYNFNSHYYRDFEGRLLDDYGNLLLDDYGNIIFIPKGELKYYDLVDAGLAFLEEI